MTIQNTYQPDYAIVRYGEIALKGKNRRVFLNQLINNISQTLNISKRHIRKLQGQVRIELRPEIDVHRLAQVLGIVSYQLAVKSPNKEATITERALALARDTLQPNETFVVRCKRSNKQFPKNSAELERDIGAVIHQSLNAPVQLKHPDHTVSIHIGKHHTHISVKQYAGLSGLPVGTSGKVLCLLSGGFDSIAAGYRLARRGAQVDFLHFHVYTDSNRLQATKIPRIVQALAEYTLSQKLFTVSDLPYQMAALGLDESNNKLSLVIFRRLMARVAEKIAREQGYHMLVFGDSLGQVASQTMENLIAVDSAVTIPIVRPVIGFDKVEIIDDVRQLGMESLATESYKDCCSIIAHAPDIKAHLPDVISAETQINIKQVIEEMANSVEVLPITNH